MSRMSELHALLSDLIPAVVHATVNNGGISTNLRGETPVDGYMVGGKASVTINPLRDGQSYSPLVSRLTEWADQNLDAMAGGAWLGTWDNAGMVYIELSDRVDTLRDAVLLGDERRELAIWDVVGAREIRLAGPSQECAWFALCDHLSAFNVPHPVLGSVPTCARCYANNVLPFGKSAYGYEHTTSGI